MKKLLLALCLVSMLAGCGEDNRETGKVTSPLIIHPDVFSWVECWLSDTESPVITEINLDAVGKNRNQFSKDEIQQMGEWIVYQEADQRGFRRYRLIEKKDNHYKVQYQMNGGGSLTTSCMIEFSLDKREIHKNGEPTMINVLRVESYDSN